MMMGTIRSGLVLPALVAALSFVLGCGGSGREQVAVHPPDAADSRPGDLSIGTGDLPPEVAERADGEPGPDGSDLPVDAPRDAEPTSDGPADQDAPRVPVPEVRVPAEWEHQAGTWMQWPPQWEASLRPDFGRVISVVQEYQPVHLLVLDKALEENARDQIAAVGGDPDDVIYHEIPYDNSWMRDNGPVFAYRQAADDSTDGATVDLQDWGFDAWGGNFGDGIPFEQDDAVPAALADLLDIERLDYGDYVLERGNLESNGAGTVVLGWDCQQDRNPGWSKEGTEALLEDRLGAKQVLWVHGHDPEDLTTGHVDGVVRFVDATTVAVARSLIPGDPTAALLDDAAGMLAQAGFDVVRIDIPGAVPYKGIKLPAIYSNWLVGNGFVAAMAFGNPDWDAAAKEKLKGLFPGRDVHMVEALELWYHGGGIHCITNDQPGFPDEPGQPEPVDMIATDSGGFDDFSSPGAALGFAVDEMHGLVLVAALKFDLPLADKDFLLGPDVAVALAGYAVKPCPVLAEAVAQYPWLASVVTDTAGVRTMPVDATVFLLEGDLASPAPAHVYIADGGLLSLHRVDDPKDILDGSATFVEVTGIGPGAQVLEGGKEVEVAQIYFEWATGKQP